MFDVVGMICKLGVTFRLLCLPEPISHTPCQHDEVDRMAMILLPTRGRTLDRRMKKKHDEVDKMDAQAT